MTQARTSWSKHRRVSKLACADRTFERQAQSDLLMSGRGPLLLFLMLALMPGVSLAQEPLNEVFEREVRAQMARFQAMQEEEQERENNAVDVEVTDEEFYLPVDQRMAADIEGMIGHLSSPDYGERKAAYDGLIQIGAPALRFLRDEYARTDDLESRLTIERIAYRVYLDHHVYSRHAFLGISLRWYEVAGAEKDNSPENIVGVLVTDVISDTAAERAGLLPNDIIIAADGQPLSGHGDAIVQMFSKSIASRQPGARMLLTVARPGSGKHDLEVTLGRVPRERVQQTSISEKFFHVDRRFAVWWDLYFVGESPAESDSE